ncbi:MAG: DUF5721 family protein [Lachnospiraceae bacterium]|nr:DUF5721 family protein [Lachnospiraceae bacterium]
MHSFLIHDIKSFTAALFTGELFDRFLLSEADIITDVSLHVDGRINLSYFDDPSLITDGHVTWGEKKPLFYSVIKGKHLPLSFKIVLCLSEKNLKSTLAASGLNISEGAVDNLFMNIGYKSGTLTVTSGISIKTFTMDKSLPEYWDGITEKFLKMNGFSYE